MGLQRRPDLVGPDAHLFRPERWDSWSPDMWEFIPFNHGPRICLGRNFGQQQCEYVLVRICQEFEKIVPGALQMEQKIKLELNTKAAYPIVCTFVRGEGAAGREV
jgi:cytochrome P450